MAPTAAEGAIGNTCQILFSHHAEQTQPTTRWRVCQNIDIRSTRFEDSAIEAASQFQGDSMANLSSRASLVEHFLVLSTLS
jgi:hypothetical protein